MFHQLGFVFIGIGAMGAAAVGALTVPMLRSLPEPGRVSMDGITTIDDAVEACRRSHLQGCELVAYGSSSYLLPYSKRDPACSQGIQDHDHVNGFL